MASALLLAMLSVFAVGSVITAVMITTATPHTPPPVASTDAAVLDVPAPSGNVTWHFEYRALGPPGSHNKTALTTVAVTVPMPAQYTHVITETPTPVLAGVLAAEHIVLLRVYRSASVASDTSVDSAYVFSIDAVFPVWKHASAHRTAHQNKSSVY